MLDIPAGRVVAAAEAVLARSSQAD